MENSTWIQAADAGQMGQKRKEPGKARQENADHESQAVRYP